MPRPGAPRGARSYLTRASAGRDLSVTTAQMFETATTRMKAARAASSPAATAP
ncbi:hypothetical protein GLE_3072 [Lysobacter enzymogenes]|uniref:Uncharacterized protein n=1 Tax=Lysobacter enzymogenes TaxID=69 RepID=A0A0S2DIS6_LYSEN|nr:hypothetical protein GLE_3072 [Lysobacter enzymogenes]